MSAGQVDALVGKVGEPTRDKRTLADLTVHSDPIPVLVPGVGLVGTAQAQLTDDGVTARITADETWTQRLLAGTLHAHIDTTHGRIVTGADGGAVLHDGRLRAITLTQAPNAWDGTWVAPVRS